jgi:hypothetical protein
VRRQLKGAHEDGVGLGYRAGVLTLFSGSGRGGTGDGDGHAR